MPQMSQLPFLGLKLVPKPVERAREPWSWGRWRVVYKTAMVGGGGGGMIVGG